MDFKLPLGIDIPDITGLSDGFSVNSEDSAAFTAYLSCEKIFSFLKSFTDSLPEPIFFFLELPCTSEEEKNLCGDKGGNGGHYKLYYLDNCTKSVISAILKEYGSLLINDGVCRFGFGGNESGDELYVQTYKVMSIYCADPKLNARTAASLSALGAQKTDSLTTPWDIVSQENAGTCMCIEDDGISVYDLPTLLCDAGMYFSEIV